MAEQKILISIQVKTGKSNQQIKATTKSLDQLATTQKKVSTGTDQMRATSGLNNAILMETSRLASDASFGFTAIANNLSQLVNLFKASKDATGSFTQSIKSLLTAQAAFLVGFQLLITFGDDIFKAIMKAVSGVDLFKKGFEDAGSTVENSAGKFETYIRTLQDSNKSQEEQRKAIQGLNKDFPDFVKQLEDADVTLKDVADSTERATEQTDLYRDAIMELAMARAAQNEIDKLSVERLNLVVERQGKVLERGFKDEEEVADKLLKLKEENGDKLLKADADFADITSVRDTGLRNQLLKQFEQSEGGKLRSRAKSLEALLGYNQTEIDAIDEQIDYYIDFTKIEFDQDKKRGSNKRKFVAGQLDFEKQIIAANRQRKEARIKDEEALLRIEIQAQKDSAEATLNAFKRKQQARVDALEDDTLTGDALIANQKRVKDAQDKVDKEIQAATESYYRFVDAKNEEQEVKIDAIGLANLEKQRELNRKKLDEEAKYNDERSGIVGNYSFFEKQRNIDSIKEQIAAQKETLLIYKDGTKEKEEAELKLYQLKRQLSEEDKELQLQGFAFIKEQFDAVYGALEQTFQVSTENQTIELEENYARRIEAAEGNADEQDRLERELAVKKDKIARKQFERDKAMRVSSALMTVYQNGFLAYGSQLFPGDVSSPVRAAIQQAVTIAAGLANVANIARQKYQSKVTGGGASSGGSAGGGRSIQAPDFNVVGASQTSQLAESVAGQQAKPVKAFVVGKDISTQQELDRNITNTASFG